MFNSTYFVNNLQKYTYKLIIYTFFVLYLRKVEFNLFVNCLQVGGADIDNEMYCTYMKKKTFIRINKLIAIFIGI